MIRQMAPLRHQMNIGDLRFSLLVANMDISSQGALVGSFHLIWHPKVGVVGKISRNRPKIPHPKARIWECSKIPQLVMLYGTVDLKKGLI